MFYGTLKSELDRIWALGKNVVFDIDVVGGLNIKKQFPNNTLSIFIKPPSTEALAERLRQRGTDSTDKIAMRLDKANVEMARANEFDAVVVNDHLETAKSETEEYISNFLAGRSGLRYFSEVLIPFTTDILVLVKRYSISKRQTRYIIS